MGKLSEIINVNVTLGTQTISRTGFGTGLILGSNGTFGENTVRSYADLDEVLEDFESTDDEYLAASAYFGQDRKPEEVKIGVRATPVAMVQTITFSADLITDNVVTIDVDGETVTQNFDTLHLTTMTALADKIAAKDGVATAVVGGVGNRVITCTAATAGIPFTLSDAVVTGGATQATITIATTVENVGVVEDLTEIALFDNDWYGLILCDRDAADVELAAEYIEANEKIFGTVTEDPNCLTSASTDIGSILQDLNYDRTFVIYNEDSDDYAEAAWMGLMFPAETGSETWNFKQVSGVVASVLTTTQRNYLKSKNINWFEEYSGYDIMQRGMMASGEWIDVINGADWLKARIEEDIYYLFITVGKVPYTDNGVSMVEGRIRARIEEAIDKNIIRRAPEEYDGQDYIVEFPKVADVPASDRADRLLPDGVATCMLAGAIHKAELNIYLSA